MELPDGGLVLTGRLSLADHPWLADHVITGRAVLPGAALAELAVAAGDQAGCAMAEELILHTPLVIPATGALTLRVTITGPAGGGQRTADIFSRASHDATWTRNATAALTPDAAPAGFDLAAWPPPAAEPVDVAGFYDRLPQQSVQYGPAFRGLKAAWRRGQDVFAEVSLPEGVPAGSYGLHPALLDAALHPIGLQPPAGSDGDGPMLPFAWSGVVLHASGATTLRVHITPTAPGTYRLHAADPAGNPVATITSLALRPIDPTTLTRPNGLEWLFDMHWQPYEVPGGAGLGVVVLGEGGLAGLGEVPPVVVAACLAAGDDGVPAGVRAAVDEVLGLVQAWVADDRFAGSRLVIVTRGAVAALPGEVMADLAGAAAWGLVASAQAEHPGQVVLADADAGLDERVLALIAAAAGVGEPRLAYAGGRYWCRDWPGPASRTCWQFREGGTGGWRSPSAAPWRAWERPAPAMQGGPLEAGQVRVDVRAAGVNFRDVLNVLGMYPGDGGIPGAEGAGVVTATGPGVAGLAVGDAVMGMFGGGAFGPSAVSDHRLLVRVPGGWSFAEAATVPVAFATAFYALVDLAGLRAGESVLIHAAAGGVGMAAVQIARHLGARVYATASPGKWEVLAGAGVDPAHIASSRTIDFERAFLDATGSRGVDVVLDCLRGEFVDASLRLLAAGGRFVEMGKADIRDLGQAAAAAGHPVSYQAFDLMDAGPERIAQILAELGRPVRLGYAVGVAADGV